ncbi:MAG: hypothetical protein RBR86_05640 [Pseudobdellovibrionaceae bacterium]|jgi:hypothetical protein|nr:hypothetical protein [Pseudobdellovibrionaceae bacterium]
MVSRCKYRESGNALFLILIAVALFGALTYAVSSSTRSGSTGGGRQEDNEVIASSLLQYASGMAMTVERMRLSNGCSESNISFETPLMSYDHTHSPPVLDKCKVFHPSGGGYTYQENLNWYNAASYNTGFKSWATFITGDYNIVDVGTDASDLIMFIFPLTLDVCNKINEKLGVTYPGTTPPFSSGGDSDPFQGTYATSADNMADEPGSVYAGHSAACTYGSIGTHYALYYTLLER